MGAWGYGIRQDDFVCDVIGMFEDLLKKGSSVADASESVRLHYARELIGPDDRSLFWIGLAEAQWTYGQVDPEVFQHVKDDFNSGRSLVPWEEEQKGLSRRKAALAKFLQKIAQANPRPKKPPKMIIRKPKFQAGDCLCIHVSNGQYGAALVLAADQENLEYGQNLIGVLNYLSSEKPQLSVFRERNWLHVTHHKWNNMMDLAWYGHVGFRDAKSRLEVIGEVALLESDPKQANRCSSWANLGEHLLLQRAWDTRPTN